KTRSPSVMGHDAPGPGSSAFQTMFSVDDHLTGSPFSSLTPNPPGPRNCVQSPAKPAAESTAMKEPASATRREIVRRWHPKCEFTTPTRRMSGSSRRDVIKLSGVYRMSVEGTTMVEIEAAMCGRTPRPPLRKGRQGGGPAAPERGGRVA